MADGMFGTPIGVRAYEADQREALRIGVGAEEALGRIAAQPAQLRKTEAEAGILEQNLQAERQMAEIMRRSAMGGAERGEEGGSLAGRFDALARAAADAGLVTKASDLAKTAALLNVRESSEAASAAQRARTVLQTQRERINLTGQLFGGVADEAGWRRANELFEFQTGMPSPYGAVPYSPALVERIEQNALTAKERLDLEEKRLTRLETEAYRGRRLNQFDAQQAVRDAQLAIARAREARLRKAGGRAVAAPSDNETEQARRLIKQDYDALEPTDLSNAAYDIASEARVIRRENPAIGAAQALQQAYNAAKAGGDFEILSGGVLGLGRKQGYVGTGKTPQTAAALPEDSSRLRSGRFYVNGKGQVAKWTGKGFELVGDIGGPLSTDNGRVDEE